MPKITGTISAAPSILNKLVFVLFKTTAPAAEITRIVKDAPHPTPYNFAFTDIEAGTFIVKVHESADGVTLGNLRHDYWQDSKTDRLLFERRFYRVDGADPYDPPSVVYDPVDDEIVYNNKQLTDPYLDGKNIVGLFKEGFRFLKEDLEFVRLSGGTLQLRKDFEGNELYFDKYTVYTVDITYDQIADSKVEAAYTDIITLPGITALNSEYFNKVLEVVPAGNTSIVYLPLVSSVPNGKGFLIRHGGGNAPNVEIQAQSGEIITFRTENKNSIFLGIGEWVKIVKSFGAFKVIENWGQWERVGERIGRDALNEYNQVVCDRSEYDGAIYKRIYDYVDNLPTDNVVSYAEANTVVGGYPINAGFFAIDRIAKKILVPDMRDQSIKFLKNIGGTDTTREQNIAGGFQKDGVKKHTHSVTKYKNDSKGGDQQNTLYDVPESGTTPVNIIVGENAGGTPENLIKNIGMIPMLLI